MTGRPGEAGGDAVRVVSSSSWEVTRCADAAADFTVELIGAGIVTRIIWSSPCTHASSDGAGTVAHRGVRESTYVEDFRALFSTIGVRNFLTIHELYGTA